MKGLSKFVAALVAALVVLVFGAGLVGATEIAWKKTQLNWNGTSATRNFTASAADTAFLTLPSDIAFEALPWATAAAYPYAKIIFTCSAAAGDTLFYNVIDEAGGVKPFVDPRVGASAVGNCAINQGGNRVLAGVLLTNPTSHAMNLISFPLSGKIKVAGDASGTFTGVKAWLVYPARAAAK